jgi:hypothetical protein
LEEDMAVNWKPTYAAALSEARSSGKPLFVDFFHPG